MKIIISPAKKMNTDTDYISSKGLPVFLEKTKKLNKYLKSLSYEELKKLLVCNDEIATLNFQRFQSMDIENANTPAILAYDGIQYKYMAPQVFEYEYFDYVQKHLRILSGFYGIIKPMDAVTPYRLEMQAKLKTDFCKNLYDYWKDDIYNELIKEDKVILNLASYEYSKVIEKYLTEDITYITCIFGELIDGNIKEKSVYVKMARGEMVRFLAENKIEVPENIKNFNRLGFKYSKELSTDTKYIFLKER